jgi:hypothetical protein
MIEEWTCENQEVHLGSVNNLFKISIVKEETCIVQEDR